MQKTYRAKDVDATFRIVIAITETIRELKEVPSGHLYAQVMGHMSLEAYERVIEKITGTGLVERTPGHLLRWIGPEIK